MALIDCACQGRWAAILHGAPHDLAAWVDFLPDVGQPTIEVVPRVGEEPEHLLCLPDNRVIADDGEAQAIATGLVEHLDGLMYVEADIGRVGVSAIVLLRPDGNREIFVRCHEAVRVSVRAFLCGGPDDEA